MSYDENTSGQLSTDAFAEFKAQYFEEFPTDKTSDGELHIRAISVLRFFALLQPSVDDEVVTSINVTDEEARILVFLHRSICHEGRSPSIRDVAETAGLRSSRSGMRIVDRFMERNWLSRNTEGRLDLAEWLKDCNTVFHRPNA